MEWLRLALARLGWPVETLCDQEVADELYRRWRAWRPGESYPGQTIGCAAATGIFMAMASDGNLDALCWSTKTGAPTQEQTPIDEVEQLAHSLNPPCGEPDPPSHERRRSERVRGNDVVGFGETLCGDHPSGWLVDSSQEGIAFIAETRDAPLVGSRILSTVDHRDGGPVEFGPATVVRTELLNETLSLVCAQREATEGWKP